MINDALSVEDYEQVLEKYKENGGLFNARNNGIKQCISKYIAFLKGDDMYAPDELLRKNK